MKKAGKATALALAAAMLIAGCGGQGGAVETAGTRNAEGKYDPQITITIAKQLDENTGRYGDGEDINKNPMVDLAVEKLGIKMETTLLGGDASNYDTKLRLALTGSEELPDVFPVYGTQMIADMIESGQVKAIDEDIENYMPDRLKEIYDQYPETFYPVTKDGKTYGIACAPCLTEGQVMVIRQDWLDNLGLSAPTNMDEFEEVIQAFTEDDPDGNGQDDTYGFTYAGDSIYNTGWVADPVPLFSAYAGKYLPGTWQEDENGQLVYGSIQEGNRKTLERMAQWHANGWMFQEAAATGAWDAMMQFTEGKAGIFIGRPWAIDSVRDVTTVAPDAVIKAYPNILQDNGDPTYQTAQVNDGWLMFSSDFNNMEAFFVYYDWLYDGAFGTGGIIGWIRYFNDPTAYAVSETVAVTDNDSTGKISGGASAGGIVGHIYNRAVVSGNTNTAAAVSAKTFAAGIAGSLQLESNNMFADEEADIDVTGNVSTTPVGSITADCADQFAYNNDKTHFTVENNGDKA